MLRSYMDNLRKVKTLTNLYNTMGWKENSESFVMGDTVVKNDGGTVTEERSTLSSTIGRQTPDMYPVKGSLAAWKGGTGILQKAGMHAHMFALGVGFSAPLYAFTGLKGLTISLYGPTGGGKTLAQYWLQSIYGDPERLHFAAKFTQNVLFSRLGMYNNLPMTIDEATMLPDKEVGDFLYWVSQGRDKARLTRSAEERDQKTWATPVVVSTNKSLAMKLVSSGLDTDAQMARLLEVTVPQHPLFSKDSTAGQKIYTHIMNNYGHAGRKYIAYLVSIGPDAIEKRIEQHRTDFRDEYGAKFSGEERYWQQAVMLSDLGSKIADELGLIDYDYRKGTRWVLEQLGAVRKVAKEARQDTFDLLAEYLNEMADSAVSVMVTGAGKPYVDLSRVPRGEIRVRFTMWRKDLSSDFTRGTVLLDRAHFRKWLSSKNADYRTFVEDINRHGLDATPKSQKAYLAKDTPAKVPQTYVLGIDLANPKLEGLLNEADKNFDAAAFSKLTVV